MASKRDPNRWVVHKFGGTSVGSADCMRKCIEIIRPLLNEQRVAVVVSAIGGKPKVTDLLLDSVHAAANGKVEESQRLLQMIHEKHKLCISDILKNAPSKSQEILDGISSDLKDIGDLLKAVTLMKMAHEQILELVSGYGEIWSATIMTSAMRQAGLPFVFLNARDVLLVSENNLGTQVHWSESEEKLQQYISKATEEFKSSNYGMKDISCSQSIALPHLMITGYVASTLDGVATTLKRDGSDFSASIFGKMLKATGITIWTDVSGVYSADPRRVPEAQIIPEVSYTEAIELAYFGAKVIHPKTMAPAITDQIPIYIRNTFEPSHQGTRIYEPPVKGKMIRENCVCGFSTVDNVALLNIEGTGMIGVPGIAHRLFGSLKAANISVMFIAQASSEHSICFATKEGMADVAKKSIEEAFFYELKQGLISKIRIIHGCSIIAAVGESMSNMPGVSGLFFGALGASKVNVLSISQGCDERNISAVVYANDATKALRAVHSAFWLSSLDLNIGLVGVGRVGSAFLRTLLENIHILGERFGLNMKIRGIASSQNMLLGEDLKESLQKKMQQQPFNMTEHLTNSKINGTLRRATSQASLEYVHHFLMDDNDKVSTDLNTFYTHVVSGGTPHTIIIDASTSQAVAELHPGWLTGGAHIVTANKRAISSHLDLYNAVFAAVRAQNRLYMSEVTIGAALPIRTTLNDLLCSGDAVHSIVGLMSVSAGTVLTWICDDGLSFSDAVLKTYEAGLFEDDCFLDLEGIEAAQKLLILGRLLGIPLELSDIEIEPLARRREVISWQNVSTNGSFQEENIKMKARADKARSNNCTLRYIQRIECSVPAELGQQHKIVAKASIKLEEVPLISSYAMVKGPVYHFAFHTERYRQHPLIVQGPLSDSANTASGIIGDMLRIAKTIGAKEKGSDALTK